MTPCTVTVVGLGLIGGSVLRAVTRAGLSARGYDSDPATRHTARQGDPGWYVADQLDEAVTGADLVLLAVPLPALPAVLDQLAGYGGLLTDVISTKQPVRAAVAERLPTARYVGGHPMSGRELAGFAAGDAALFDDRAWVLCLEPETDLADWLAVARLALALGSRAVPTDAAEHDAAVARISHVPRLTAAALAARAGGSGQALARTLAAGSFTDGTRVAAGAPTLSGAICGGNPDAVRDALDDLLRDLHSARAALDGADPIGALTDWFQRGHQVRTAWPPVAGRTATMRPDRAKLLALGRAGGWVTAVDAADAELTVRYPR